MMIYIKYDDYIKYVSYVDVIPIYSTNFTRFDSTVRNELEDARVRRVR